MKKHSTSWHMRAGVEWTGKLLPGGGREGGDAELEVKSNRRWRASHDLTHIWYGQNRCISASSQPEGLHAGDSLQIMIFLCTEADKSMHMDASHEGRHRWRSDFLQAGKPAWLAFMLTLQGQTGCRERVSYTAPQKLAWWLLSCATNLTFLIEAENTIKPEWTMVLYYKMKLHNRCKSCVRYRRRPLLFLSIPLGLDTLRGRSSDRFPR